MIKEKLNNIKESLPSEVLLVAVSKTKPNSAIIEAYRTGQRVFGENKALELRDKARELPKDIDWHFIGRLQTNKVKYVVANSALIHSIDRLKLVDAIDKEAKKKEKIQEILIQVNISEEESKTGFGQNELNSILSEVKNYSNIKVVGLMTMAPFLDNPEDVRWVFTQAKRIFDEVQKTDDFDLKYLSMGMSNDYQVAIEEGSNMIRVGSKIFGSRY